MTLNEHEHITFEIEHTKKLPFRLEDWIRSSLFVGLIVAAIASLRFEGLISMGSIFLLVVFFYGIRPLYQRWKRLQPLHYFMTNERLIIFHSEEDEIKHSFYFTSFPEIHLHENLRNFGYIIIGEFEPTFAHTGLKWGVNLNDHQLVLENIPEVRKVYELLMEKAESAKESRNN
ncbi:MAG: hypothetical protein RLZZ30_1417 [Bacteroidota bacterium]|jgi:hypothetical protein